MAKVWPIWAIWSILFVGVVLRWIGVSRPAAFDQQNRVTALAPKLPDGWTVSDTPLGDTELEAGDTVRTLDFSDYFFKTYRKGSLAVRLYVAYWAPARIDPSLVAIHRPETCWAGAGARILAHQEDYRIITGPVKTLLPAEYDRFQFPSSTEDVLFWHRYGRQIFPFHALSGSFLEDRFGPFLHSILFSSFSLGSKDQMVIRISTNGPIEGLLASDLWTAISESLLKGQLGAPSSSAAHELKKIGRLP